jgi:(p)ppGpp synthase/HD superfamily hydrolase
MVNEQPPLQVLDLAPSTQQAVAEFQQALDATFEGEERQAVEDALQLMCEVHADQDARPDGTPYVEHPLQVASGVLSNLVEPDADIVNAALLHDSVEDQAKKLAAKLDPESQASVADADTVEGQALGYIRARFGDRTARIVDSVSTPDFNAILTHSGQEVTPEKVNQLNTDHVEEAIEDPDVLPVKLSDFAGNGLRLDQVKDPEQRTWLSSKYLPLIPVFIRRLGHDDHALTPEFTQEMIERLQAAQSEMEDWLQLQAA